MIASPVHAIPFRLVEFMAFAPFGFGVVLAPKRIARFNGDTGSSDNNLSRCMRNEGGTRGAQSDAGEEKTPHKTNSQMVVTDGNGDLAGRFQTPKLGFRMGRLCAVVVRPTT